MTPMPRCRHVSKWNHEHWHVYPAMPILPSVSSWGRHTLAGPASHLRVINPITLVRTDNCTKFIWKPNIFVSNRRKILTSIDLALQYDAVCRAAAMVLWECIWMRWLTCATIHSRHLLAEEKRHNRFYKHWPLNDLRPSACQVLIAQRRATFIYRVDATLRLLVPPDTKWHF
jgi:hypothetical protein